MSNSIHCLWQCIIVLRLTIHFRLHVRPFFYCEDQQSSLMQNLPELFFDYVAISSWNGKGAPLKLKLKRVKHNTIETESVLCPIEEQLPLDLKANCAPYNDSEGKDDSVQKLSL